MSQPSAYGSAIADLLARLWLELERLIDVGPTNTPRNGRADARSAIVTLRLELVLLIDGCECARWRAVLGQRACAELRSLLCDVLASLDGPAGEVDALRIGGTQNRLLDEILKLYAAARGDGDGPRARKLA